MGGRNIYPTDIERVAETVDGRPGRQRGRRALETSTVGVNRSRLRSSPGQAADPDEADRIAADVRAVVTAAIGARPAAVTVLPVGSPAEDAVGQAATGGDGEADHLKLHVATAYRGNPERARDVRAAPPAEGTRS